jgi:septum formation protein
MILEKVGITFAVKPAHVEELDNGDPIAIAKENAQRKALAVGGELVLGADTLVTIDNEVLGKPRGVEEARSHLNKLRGRRHQVVTAIALASDRVLTATAVEQTDVYFRAFDDQLLNWYIATNEWHDRAGAYSIDDKGAALIQRIDGDYLTVVGLPLAKLLDLHPELL